MDLEEALATPPQPETKFRDKPAVPKAGEPGTYNWDGSTGTINTQPTTNTVTTWDDYIRDAGLDPDEVEVQEPVQVRGWDSPVGEGNVVRMHYYRLTVRRKRPGLSTDELIALVKKSKRPANVPTGSATFVVALGDLQLGKMDGDGAEGVVQRVTDGLQEAAERLKALRKYKSVGSVHLAWLGDCIEGFVSQNGANAWRTNLTLTEQIRILRRLMLFSVEVFAPLTDQLTSVAVPGNHDQALRFGKNGVTTYDDSFDTDALLAVADACKLNSAFDHAAFHIPERDEMSVTLTTSNTTIGHAHGHQMGRSGQHFAWWSKQSFGDQQIGEADILLAGHYHHFVYDTSGRRKFIQVPALESESTWFRHRYGEIGDPGVLTFLTKDGGVNNIEIL